MTTPKAKLTFSDIKDYFFIVLGLTMYAVGFTAFILPHAIVMGGVSGLGTLVYFATDRVIPVAVTGYAVNLILLAMAWKIVGGTFVRRTIFSATVIALGIGFFQEFFMRIGHPLLADTAMSAILGAILAGMGVGIAFIHNGSTGGTDIVAAMVSKVSNVSIGRTMMFVDMVIVTSSIFLPFEGNFEQRLEARVPIIIYGYVVTFVISYCADMVINSNRQATEFTIISQRWEEIADAINTQAHRGVTVIDGQGWYTKHDVKMLLVWCRKIESVTIFRIIKSVDPDAFVTQGKCNGVYGKGFDSMKIRTKNSSQNKKQ